MCYNEIMELIIGGYAQKKVEYAKTLEPDAEIINDLHLMIKERLTGGAGADSVFEEISGLVSGAEGRGKKIIIISDEIGCGIVPLDGLEREWREVTGRILCRLAERAEKVTRIVMGLPQVIKG